MATVNSGWYQQGHIFISLPMPLPTTYTQVESSLWEEDKKDRQRSKPDENGKRGRFSVLFCFTKKNQAVQNPCLNMIMGLKEHLLLRHQGIFHELLKANTLCQPQDLRCKFPVEPKFLQLYKNEHKNIGKEELSHENSDRTLMEAALLGPAIIIIMFLVVLVPVFCRYSTSSSHFPDNEPVLEEGLFSKPERGYHQQTLFY